MMDATTIIVKDGLQSVKSVLTDCVYVIHEYVNDAYCFLHNEMICMGD